MRIVCLLVIVALVLAARNSSAQTAPANAPQESPTTIGGKWFLGYRAGDVGNSDLSRFGVDRGYIVIRHRLTDRLSGRITPDVTVDREGDGEGDLKVRLKYAYVDYRFNDVWIFSEPHVEFGLVHRPWLDYEEHVNYYRVQGTMFLERNGIFNSADYGLTAFSLLGGRMDDAYQKRVNARYPGRYGSIALGIYNGGGYHAIEKNTNKTLEGRLTVRPLPRVLPGLQFSYHGVHGYGNQVDRTDWTVNLLFTSWESRHLVLVGQYYWGQGNFKGTAVDAQGAALSQDGYSLFGEWRFEPQPFSLLGRYDVFDDSPDTNGGESKRIIAGVAYHVKGHSKVLVNYDVESRDGFDSAEARLVTFSVEFNF